MRKSSTLRSQRYALPLAPCFLLLAPCCFSMVSMASNLLLAPCSLQTSINKMTKYDLNKHFYSLADAKIQDIYGEIQHFRACQQPLDYAEGADPTGQSRGTVTSAPYNNGRYASKLEQHTSTSWSASVNINHQKVGWMWAEEGDQLSSEEGDHLLVAPGSLGSTWVEGSLPAVSRQLRGLRPGASAAAKRNHVVLSGDAMWMMRGNDDDDESRHFFDTPTDAADWIDEWIDKRLERGRQKVTRYLETYYGGALKYASTTPLGQTGDVDEEVEIPG